VLVSALAPDVALSEFNGARVEYKDIQVIKQIGEGGFAKVYKAVWNGEIIALKQLTLDTSSTVESPGFEFEDAVNPLDVFKEFRAEVLLMRYAPPLSMVPAKSRWFERTHACTHARHTTN
jgi:serine/threonine protein kinase